MSPRKYLLIGLVAIYTVAAVFAIRWQFRERSWDPAVADYVAFVERERGLSFDHPVDVRWADIAQELEADFAAERRRDFDGGPDPFQEAYALLGLIDVQSDATFEEQYQDTATEQAGAFYDPTIEEIVLPIDQDPVGLGFTIVHELTHALQHQNGMLDWKLESPDSAAARTALIEGDAERVAIAWFDQLDDRTRTQFLDAIGFDESDEPAPDPANTYFETSFAASYALGLPMVQALIEVDGQREVDRLLRADDIGTSERLLDVLTPSPTSTVDAFGELELPEGTRSVDGDIGAITWFQALAPTIGTADALNAMIGYDDDAFVMIDDGGRRCARFVVLFDTADDAGQFVSAVASMAGLAEDAVVDDGQRVEVTTCAPMGDPEDQRFGTIMPVVVAQEMTVFHLRRGVGVDQARCAALAQAATVPASDPVTEFVGWDEIEAAAPGFVADCDPAVFSPR